MQRRDAVLEEKLGDWTIVTRNSNQQKDGNSCGVFVLMVGLFSSNLVQAQSQIHCFMIKLKSQ